jgi:hypothetical protein
MNLEATRLYQRWEGRVAKEPTNDYLICVSPSSKTAVSGTGKTTLATGLAQRFDISDEGFNAEEKATLSAGTLGYEIIPDVGEGSAVILDEAQGTPGAGSGLNSRRAMKTETIETIGSILANRDKRLTVILVVQRYEQLDPTIYPMTDSWLLIRRGPSDPSGPIAAHHSVVVEDYDLQSPEVKTPRLELLSWPPLDDDDEDYQTMERKKQLAKTKGGDEGEDDDAPGEIPKPVRDEKIQSLYEAGVTQATIADTFDLTQPTVSKIVD